MNGLTKSFKCNTGVRQGCLLSPRLFLLFIEQLNLMLQKAERKGLFLIDATELKVLMYADDIVILGDSVLELQRKIKVLELFCTKWGMSVYVSKTEVVVFRKGGKLGSKEKLYYCGQLIETATYYKYLGILLSSRNVWAKAVDTLSL